jgi:hypothetical protein
MQPGIGMSLNNRSGVGLFPFSNLFSGDDFAAFDPNYRQSVFTDITGETMASTTGGNVGLFLDIGQNLELGAHLSVNGGFDSDTGWTKGSGWTIAGGMATRTATGSFTNLSQAPSPSLNTTAVYLFGYDYQVTAGSLTSRLSSDGSDKKTGFTGTGSHILRVKPFGAGAELVFAAQALGFAGSVDNVTLKQINGYHATSTVAASQTWHIDGAVNYINHSSGNLTVTLPNLGTDATLAYASEDGITILEAQTISGATLLPQKARLGRVFYLDRRMTVAEYAAIYAWLNNRNTAATLARYAASNGTLPTAVIDLKRGFYYWGGSQKTVGDLTVASGLGYYIASSGVLNNSAGTTFVEWTTPETGSFAAAETLFSFANTASGDQFNGSLRDTNAGQPVFIFDTPLASAAFPISEVVHPFSLFGRRRIGVRYNAGAVYKIIEDGMVKDDTTAINVYDAISFNRITIGYRQVFGTTDQPCSMLDSLCFVYFNTALSDAVMEATAKKSPDGVPPIHVLGDSISNERLYADRGGVWSRVKHLARNQAFFAFSSSIQGGTTLEQFATRYTADSEHNASNLLIYEGGLDFDPANELFGLQTILSTNTSGRYVLIEPIKASDMPTGSAKRTDHEAAWAGLVAEIGVENIIYTHTAMKAANDGSAQDLADLADDICPTSLREDGIHPNSAGQDVLATAIYTQLASRGWFG